MKFKLFGYEVDIARQFGCLSINWRKTHRHVEWKERVIVLGFDSGTEEGQSIAPNERRNVVSRPQDTFAPKTITISKRLAKHFDIIDIKIGAVSQFSSAEPLPADVFVNGLDVKFDTAQISQDVVFVVRNKSTKPRRFQATIAGFVVRL